MDADVAAGPPGRIEQLKHELRVIVCGNPGRADACGNLRRRQVGGLHPFQSLHIDGEIVRGELGTPPRPLELLADIAGEVLISGQILFCGVVAIAIRWVQEDDAFQIIVDFRLILARQLHHIGHIHLGLFGQGDRQRFRRRVHMGDNGALLDGSLSEHIRLANKIALIIQHLKGGQEEEGIVHIENGLVGAGVDEAVLG